MPSATLGLADEPAPSDLLADEPAHSDTFVRGLSEAIGGPLGEHAARPTDHGRFWTAARIVLALVCLVLSLHWVQKSPCRDGAWQNNSQYKYFCYTDVLALYYAEGLSNGEVPYADHAVEYPVVTGALLAVLGLPVHAYGDGRPEINQGRIFYDLNAFVLCVLGVATVASILAVRRRRPWDAAMFALSPALFVSATVNWDLLAVGLAAFGWLAWARRKPVLAGVLLSLGVSAKLYPVLFFLPLLLLAARAGRWRAFMITSGTAVATWVAVNLPVAVAWTDNWLKFWSFNSERGIDWGTLWYIGEHFPVGNGKYGIAWFSGLNTDPTHHGLNTLYFTLFVLCCVAVAALAFLAPRRPRLAQLVFLVVAAFLLTGKVWSQQYVLWLLPLAVLARPRWGAFLAWQFAELAYFLCFYGELMGASGKSVFPEWVFVFASVLRWVTVAVLAGFVVRDVLNPELDAVRRIYPDDPDGGDLDGAGDVLFVVKLRNYFSGAGVGAPQVTPWPTGEAPAAESPTDAADAADAVPGAVAVAAAGPVDGAPADGAGAVDGAEQPGTSGTAGTAPVATT